MIWQTFDDDFSGRAGELVFRLHRMAGGWRIGWVYAPEDETPAMDEGSVAWRHFAMPESSLRLTPAMPEHPVVVRPAAPLVVFPGHTQRVYVTVPLVVRIEGGDPERTLFELPSMRLSLSWFGRDTKEGRLCYALKTRARDTFPEPGDPESLYRVICPLEVVNASAEVRAFERFCLLMPQMRIFRGAHGRFWGNRSRLTWRGTAVREEAFLDDIPPRESQPAEQVTPARVLPGTGGILHFFS